MASTMNKLYYKDTQILGLPININDTSASTTSTYSSTKIQGELDTINTTKMEIESVPALPVSPKNKIYKLTKVDGEHTQGLYIYIGMWYKFKLEETA